MNELMPVSFSEKMQMSQVLAKSGLIPQGLNTPEKVCVALQWGAELGLSPMVAVNNVAVVNGKPTLSADIMHAIVRHNPEYGGLKWNCQDEKKAECIITRVMPNGIKEETIGRYTWEDAQKAGLTGKDNWKKYPARMLKHRALSYALRDAFPDALAGIYMPEEMENPACQIQKPEESEKELKDVTPKEETESPSENREGLLKELAEIMNSVQFGNPVFSDEEKAHYRTMVNAVGITATLEEVKKILPEKISGVKDVVEKNMDPMDIY